MRERSHVAFLTNHQPPTCHATSAIASPPALVGPSGFVTMLHSEWRTWDSGMQIDVMESLVYSRLKIPFILNLPFLHPRKVEIFFSNLRFATTELARFMRQGPRSGNRRPQRSYLQFPRLFLFFFLESPRPDRSRLPRECRRTA